LKDLKDRKSGSAFKRLRDTHVGSAQWQGRKRSASKGEKVKVVSRLEAAGTQKKRGKNAGCSFEIVEVFARIYEGSAILLILLKDQGT